MNAPSTIRVLEFKTEYKLRKGEAVETDWVKYAPVTAVMTSQVWARVKDITPPDEIEGDEGGEKMARMQQKWEMIKPHYDAWKKGEELPEFGTPLAAWGALSAEQIKVMASHSIKTIEDVAAMTEALTSKIPLPRIRDLPKLAKAFLENSEKAETNERLLAVEEQNKALQEQLAAAMELLEQQTKKTKTRDAA